MRNGLDALCPDSLVKFGVDPHVRCTHCLVGKIDDGFHSPWGPLFERTAMHAFVQVDSVLAAYDVLERGAGLAASLCWMLDTDIRRRTWLLRGLHLFLGSRNLDELMELTWNRLGV